MECLHLEEAVDTSPKFIKHLMEENRTIWSCSECRSTKSPWMCLKCGQVLCGRYVNGHCKMHADADKSHCVCIDSSLMVFCYNCDDFVINDTTTGNVSLIRTALQTEHVIHARRKRRKSEVEALGAPEKKRRAKENMYGSSPKRIKTAGLRNLGNTCFMNAILQSLSNLKHFSCYFKDLPAIELHPDSDDGMHRKYYTRSCQTDEVSLVEELRKVLCALWQGSTQAICPDALFSVIWKVVPRFRGYQQHDAHEFMHYLLDCVHNELLQSPKFSNGSDTIVTAIFGGELQSEVTCLKCGCVSTKLEPYLDLSLDIPYKPINPSGKARKPGEVCHLVDCLQRFVELETLAESEWYTCGSCKKRQPSTKKFWLVRLPNVLCLHMKRFRYSSLARTKLDTYVRYPIQDLDMNPYLLKQNTRLANKANRNIYDLAAVVVHHGSGTGSGHYTAYARHEGSWYNFNDSTVSQANEESIMHSKGYILFYTRQYPDISIIEQIKDVTREH